MSRVVELLPNSIKSSDEDFLELFRLLKDSGMLDKNDQLCSYFLHYTEDRF